MCIRDSLYLVHRYGDRVVGLHFFGQVCFNGAMYIYILIIGVNVCIMTKVRVAVHAACLLYTSENLIFIKENEKSLSFGDNRIRAAIEMYHAKLLILDTMSS